MKRWLFNIAAGVSLLGCVAITLLWVRSYWVIDEFPDRSAMPRNQPVPDSDHWHWLASSSRGRICLGLTFGKFGLARYRATPSDSLLNYWREYKGSKLVNVNGKQYFMWFEDEWSIVFPHALALLLMGILPAVTVFRFFRRRDEKPFMCCRKCGYDLRATPERCPECGTLIPLN